MASKSSRKCSVSCGRIGRIVTCWAHVWDMPSMSFLRMACLASMDMLLTAIEKPSSAASSSCKSARFQPQVDSQGQVIVQRKIIPCGRNVSEQSLQICEGIIIRIAGTDTWANTSKVLTWVTSWRTACRTCPRESSAIIACTGP